MEKLVTEGVAEALRGGGVQAIRLYVAACTERMAPLFMGLRVNEPGRKSDLVLYADCLRDLWYADRPLAAAAERAGMLERFPELQPDEAGVIDIADTYAFFGVLTLRHAVLAHGSGDADSAASCGHAALTAMGMLDQNVAGGGFLAEEQRLQLLSLSDDIVGLWETSVSAGRERLRAVVNRLVR